MRDWKSFFRNHLADLGADDYDWKNILVMMLFHVTLFMMVFLSVWTQVVSKTMDFGLGQVDPAFLILLFLVTIILAVYLPPKRVLQGAVSYALGYVIYCLLAYYIFASQQINSDSFSFKAFTENGFFQQDYAILLGILFCSSLAFVYIDKRFLWNFPKSNQDLVENSSLASLLAMTILSNKQILAMMIAFSEKNSSLPSSEQFSQMLKFSFYWLLVAFILGFLFTRAIKALTKNRANLSLAVLSSLAFGIILNYQFQLPLAIGEPLLGQLIFPGATLFQILAITSVALLIYWVLDRYLLATAVNLFLGGSISIVNDLKMTVRNEPLLLTDLSWLKDFGALLEFVEPVRVLQAVMTLLSLALIYVIFRNNLLKGRLLKSKYLRWAISAVLLISVSSFYQNLKQATVLEGEKTLPVVTDLARKYRVSWLGSKVNASYKSLMYVWFEQATTDIMDKPEGYSDDRIEELVVRYQEKAREINRSRTDFLSDQTIIFILSESFANPAYVPGVSLSQPVLPEIMGIKDKTTSGLMVSNGYGGGTANMEFQSLTGLPLYNFSPTVSIAYTEVVPMMTYLPAISHFFSADNRIIIHPASATNYNRHFVYRDLAFDKFMAHLNSEHKIDHVEVLGTQISDKTVYRNVLGQLDTATSQFFSVLTMQNHIPWHAADPADMVATGDGFTEEENANLTSYARLLTATDTETARFLDELSKIDKKITVVFYGDHLPGIYPHSAFNSAPETQYQTDYFIWSNYQTQKLDYPLVNSSDFQALLLAHTNAKVSPYQALLTEVLNKASVNQGSLSGEQAEVARDLEMLQYDLTLGKKYILESEGFFTLD